MEYIMTTTSDKVSEIKSKHRCAVHFDMAMDEALTIMENDSSVRDSLQLFIQRGETIDFTGPNPFTDEDSTTFRVAYDVLKDFGLCYITMMPDSQHAD
jgi:hypothetical protein